MAEKAFSHGLDCGILSRASLANPGIRDTNTFSARGAGVGLDRDGGAGRRVPSKASRLSAASGREEEPAVDEGTAGARFCCFAMALLAGGALFPDAFAFASNSCCWMRNFFITARVSGVILRM